MVQVKWGSRMVEVNCSEEELAEALSMNDEIMFGCWLGHVEEIGHEEAMKWAREYDEILRGEG
jgi:hypothetical protein